MIEKPFRGKELTGARYGRLTITSLSGFKRNKANPAQRMPEWNCVCDCGNEITVSICRLHSGNTKSCGCLHSEIAAARLHKHGLRKNRHPLYWVWQGMIQRCTNPNHHGWKWYGGKGITVCERWRDFTKFLEDMETTFIPGLTIERNDGNLGYCKDNCRWATWKEQNKNKSAPKTPK